MSEPRVIDSDRIDIRAVPLASKVMHESDGLDEALDILLAAAAKVFIEIQKCDKADGSVCAEDSEFAESAADWLAYEHEQDRED